MNVPFALRCGVLGLLLVLVACASAPDPRLYEGEGDTLRLRPAKVRMESHSRRGKQHRPEVREIVVRDGVVHTRYERTDGTVLEGTLPDAAWVGLWKALHATNPFSENPSYSVEEDVPAAGGTYHLITLERGDRVHRFSAQYRTAVLGLFVTSEVGRRMDLANQIVDLVVESQATVPAAAPVR